MLIAKASSEKKAHDIVIIDMKKSSSVCDYFVVSSGKSTTQVRAISDHIVESVKRSGQKIHHTEGEREGLWALLDSADVVAHVFLDETRRFYDLERLWADAPQERYKESRTSSRLVLKKKKRAKGKKVARKPCKPKKKVKKKVSRKK